MWLWGSPGKSHALVQRRPRNRCPWFLRLLSWEVEELASWCSKNREPPVYILGLTLPPAGLVVLDMSFSFSVSNFPCLKIPIGNRSRLYHSVILVNVAFIFQPCSTKKVLCISAGLALPGPDRFRQDKHRQPEGSGGSPTWHHLQAVGFVLLDTHPSHPSQSLHPPCPGGKDFPFIWSNKKKFLKTTFLRGESGLLKALPTTWLLSKDQC